MPRRRPTKAQLAAAPVLDNWRLSGERVVGVVSGDDRWRAGAEITSSPVADIDPARRWARTQNTLYALGFGHDYRPPALRVALELTWPRAALLALDLTAPMPDGARAAVSMLKRNSDDVVQRRTAAGLIARELNAVGRHALSDAWRILSVNATSKDSAREGEALLEIAVREATTEVGDDDVIKRVLAGWERLAAGDHEFADGELADPIAAAHMIGTRTLDANARAAATREWPLVLRVAAAPDWHAAARILIDGAPAEDAARLAAAGLAAYKYSDLSAARRVARVARVQSRLSSETFGALIFLSAHPDEPIDIDAAAQIVESAVASEYLLGDRAAKRVVRAWAALKHPDNRRDVQDLFAAAKWIVDRMLPTDTDPLPPGAGVVVLRAIGGGENTVAREAAREWNPLIGRRLPLTPVPDDIAAVRRRLAAEFPYAVPAIDALLGDLVGAEHIRLRPTLLVGEPGGGKSRLARRLAEEIGAPLARFDSASSSDDSFAGTARRWNSGEASVSARAIKDSQVANPIVLIDEIDKAGTDRRNGRLWEAMLPMLEVETARAHADQYLQAPVDLSHVSYVATANDDTVLPVPLRDRFRILRIGRLRHEHVPAVAARILRDLARELPGDDRFVEPLDGDELEIAQRLLGDGSIRRLRAIVQRLLAQREAQARRH